MKMKMNTAKRIITTCLIMTLLFTMSISSFATSADSVKETIPEKFWGRYECVDTVEGTNNLTAGFATITANKIDFIENELQYVLGGNHTAKSTHTTATVDLQVRSLDNGNYFEFSSIVAHKFITLEFRPDGYLDISGRPYKKITGTTLPTEETKTIVKEKNYAKVVWDRGILNFDVKPEIINGRTMVPLRAAFEAFGYTVDWDGDTRTATCSNANSRVYVKMNSSVIKVQRYGLDTANFNKAYDVAPQIIDGRVLVPLRVITELTGVGVQWDGNTNTVTMTGDPKNNVDYMANGYNLE